MMRLGWRKLGIRRMMRLRLLGRGLLAFAAGAGIWLGAQYDWSDAGRIVSRAIDQTIWAHALKDSPAVAKLPSAVPVWRESVGASGDLIVEHVDQVESERTKTTSSVAIFGDVRGKAVTPALPAEKRHPERAPASQSLQIEPASLAKLDAGDRITVATTNGERYIFEVVMPGDIDDQVRTGHAPIVLQLKSPSGVTATSVLLPLAPQKPEDASSGDPQQEL